MQRQWKRPVFGANALFEMHALHLSRLHFNNLRAWQKYFACTKKWERRRQRQRQTVTVAADMEVAGSGVTAAAAAAAAAAVAAAAVVGGEQNRRQR
jgi:hypothetical protein